MSLQVNLPLDQYQSPNDLFRLLATAGPGTEIVVPNRGDFVEPATPIPNHVSFSYFDTSGKCLDKLLPAMNYLAEFAGMNGNWLGWQEVERWRRSVANRRLGLVNALIIINLSYRAQRMHASLMEQSTRHTAPVQIIFQFGHRFSKWLRRDLFQLISDWNVGHQ